MSVGDAASVVSTIYGILSPPVLRQCGYILFCKSHANDLKDEIQKLKDVAARVQHSVDESRSAGDQFIQEDVLTWLKKADERIELGTRILETNKVGRVLGCVPDPKACHKLGRDSKKAIQDVQKLCSEGQNLKNVSYHRVEEQSLIVGAATSSKRKYVELKSRTAVLKFVMDALDDDKIGAIGVYGMGGVGKTTLLKEVEKGAKESKKFDGVFSVFVSQTPNLTAIRAEIDYRLKRLGYDESRKTVLILFDDLWKPLNLKDVGVPESNNKLKVKLVMTSRNKHLLANEMSCQRMFSIGVLDVEEAWRFFAVLVGSNVEDLKRKPAAVEFLKKCGGLPVSIEAFATLWKKKKMDLSSGDLSEDELKHAKESPDGFVSLEMSYNSLEDEDEENLAKLVFRTIGLLNTPTVPVLTLIKYMVGLGLFGSSTSNNIVERARMEITRSLRTLQESSLLLESEDSDHVKIHDVVRDVAVRIASREDHALIFDPLKGVKEWSTKKLEECRAVSLTSSIALELHKEGWNSPDLNIFVLEARDEKGDHDHVELPNAKDMVKLRVMHLKNAQLTSLPSSINPNDLRNLTTLFLDNCCLEDIAVIGKLVTLQVLSITGSDLAKLPEEIGKLTKLRMLDLSKCSELVFIEPGILERLTQLEELYLRESFDKWGIEGDGGKMNASLEELNSMPWLRTLEVRIPDTSKLPQNLPLGDLVQCKVLMGESWGWSDEYNESRTLKREVKWDSMIFEEWFQSALQKTQDLHLEVLNGTIESFHELCREGFEELKHLHLQNSSSIECIMWSLEWLECSAFTALESMILEKMESLEKICDGRMSLSTFSKLKVVRVHECHKLTSIFNLSLLKNLAELEEIEISDCEVLRQIVVAEQVDGDDDDDDDDATGEEQQSVGMIGCSNIFFGRRPTKRPTPTDAEEGVAVADNEIKLLGKLRYLTLINLPEITSFFTAEGSPSDQSMETSVAPVFFNVQKVSQPPKYKEIQPITRLSLDKLQRIELRDCKSVVHFTNSQVLLKLVNLESLTIEGCESLEDIFDLEGIKPESGNVEILPKLYELKLRGLPKLEHIWKNNLRQIKGCRKLRTVEIYKCNNLLYFSSLFMCGVMEKLTEINVGDCDKMETIFLEEEGQESNASSVKTQLTSLKTIAISECPNLMTFLSRNNGRLSKSFFNQKVFPPSLESLILESAGVFEKLWCGEIPPGHESQCKLEYVHVVCCQNLLTVIPASLIERLHNLKQLWVRDCRKLEVVFDIDVGWKPKKKSKALMLPQLQEVKLEGLESLTHVMKRGSDDEIIVVGFPSLNRLEVKGCGSLIYVIPTTIATTLIELKSLEIHSCPKLQEVISGEVSERYKRNVITLPHLTSLKLTSLASLTYFSSGSHRFDFTCLKVLKIESCGSLRALIKPRSDGGTGSQDEDQANSAAQVLFNEKIQLPNLEELHIAECKSLQDICKTTSTKQIECSRDSILVFTRLTFLELGSEIRLSHLWSGSYTLEIPFLKRLRFRGTNEESFQAIMEKVYLPNLEELVVSLADIEELWHNEPLAGSFSKLKRLEVEKCHQLGRLIPSCMVKNLQNLEMLVVKQCDELDTLCELIDDREGSKLAFSPFQNLASLHVETCGWLTSLFEITSRLFEETSDHKSMQLPQLAYLTLSDLLSLNHLFYLREGGQKYALELPSLKEFLLINVGDEEAVTREVKFPEEVQIQYRLSEDVSNFFGSMAGVVTDVVKALKTNQVIIGLFGFMEAELKQAVKEEAADLFDQVVECRGGARNIQDGLREMLSISYGEAEVQRRAQRLRKTLLSYIRKRRLLLIISVDFADEEDIMMLEAAGIPRDGFDPKHFKIILVSKDKELLLKMGAHQLPIIPIGRYLGSRWKILKPQRIEVVHALLDDEQIIGMHGRRSDTKGLLTDVVSLVQRDNLCDILVEPDDNEVVTIQEKLKTALGITSCETGLLHECIRQSLLSNRNKRLILVLRDLDQVVDLEAVGIPPLNSRLLKPKNFKIILTSENEEVLQKMGAQKTFEVKSAESIESDNPFISVQDGYAKLRKLADECGSYDLAAYLALKLKDQGVDAWKNALQRLKEAPFEYKEREKVIQRIRWR